MNLDIIPNGAIKRVHVSQNDVGRTLTFELFNNSTSYTVPSGATVKIQGTKPSGFGFSETCTVSGNTATIDTTEAMTDESGNIQTELSISYNGNKIGTSNFVLAVEKNPHPDTTTDGSMDTIIPELTLLVNEVKGYAEEIEGTYHAYGSPWVASTVAQMTDTDKIYVYVGSESGYTNGNWYYYNGSTWVSGGVYNAVAVQTDTTLSVSGMSADAKVVGDEITDLNSESNAVIALSTQNIPIRWTQGTINSNNGDELSSTTKIRTQVIDTSKYESITFNNTSGYKFRTVWLDSNGAVVKQELYLAERTVISVSYGGLMQRYNITAVRVVLGKTSDANIVPSEGSALTITGVMEIETKADKINTTLSNDYKYADTDYKQVPLTSVDFSVGHIDNSGVVVTGYRPYTDFINLDDEMLIESSTYLVEAFVYNTDGTFGSKIGWTNQIFIPYVAGRKIRLLFDKTGLPNNETSPQINQIINSDIYIGVKRKKECIEESVTDVLTNMAGQNGNCLNLAFITDLHVTAFEDLPLNQVEIWNRNTNGIACVDESRNIDFVVLGGDYLWNNTNTTLVRAERAYKLLQECFYQFKDKQFALKGNHDDNSIANNANYIVTDSKRYGYLGQQYTNDVKINYGNAEKSYGFIDFERQKIRAIFINTVDIPTSYSGQHITGIGNGQLNFIANALEFDESGWGVIFFSHHLLINNATMNPSSDVEGYVTSTHGGDAIWGIIQAFKNKTTYSKVSTLTDFEYNVSVDFTNNASNTVIACINGHTHRDLSATQDGILLISTTASGFGQTAYDSEGNTITQTINTKSETSFDIFSIDRINGTVTASRYGAGQNRNWSL